jgi:regulator of protease activity HflC (stomatin/prohibitin superfamily)
MTVWNLVGLALLVTFIVVGFSRLFGRVTVFEYQHALRFVHGRLAGSLKPGSYWYLRPATTIQILEARPKVITIPGQELLSADSVSLKVSLLVEVRVADPKTAALQSADWEQALYATAQTALRATVGTRPMEEVLQARAEMSRQIEEEVTPAAVELGLELRSISIKDIMFPGSLKEAFSQTARAKQEAQAALERARGESAALRSLANSARMLEGNPNLFRMRLLQAASQSGQVVVQVAPPEAEAKAAPAGDGDPEA